MVAPSRRLENVAAMTDQGLFVWGGWTDNGLAYTYGLYDPAIDAWTNFTYTPDALPPRLNAQSVWTGQEVLIFGGWDDQYIYGVGARFNPSTGAWRSMSMVNAPSPRIFCTVIWTGSKMIVWGGFNGDYLNDGAAYDHLRPSPDDRLRSPNGHVGAHGHSGLPRSQGTPHGRLDGLKDDRLGWLSRDGVRVWRCIL